MNITTFAKYLNEKKGLNIDATYYARIDRWRQWWQGYFKPFHSVSEQTADGSVLTRPMHTLNMPKQVCEDWASLLLNDKTTLTINDKGSAQWLLGNEDQTGGLLRQLNFWPNANRLVELAMRSGTGAFLMSVDGIRSVNGAVTADPDARIWLDYLPAECILPLTIRHGVVEEVAFVSEVTIDRKSCIYLQLHTLEHRSDGSRQYKITNEFYTSKSENTESAAYTPTPLPKGMAASISTGADVPWFSIFYPAGVKHYSDGPGMGAAIFADALDAARHLDLAFDNYVQDIYLGGKKVFYDGRLCESRIGADGTAIKIPPDAARRQIFYQLPASSDPDARKEWHEYNPDLRVEDNSRAVQDALNYFSFKCGLGSRRYRFSGESVKTATEYNGSQQELVQHANRHQIQLEGALIRIVRAMLWAGKTFAGANVNPDTDITVNFDDSYITDTASRLASLRDDALEGLIPRYRYLMERYGWDETTAKSVAAEAKQDSLPSGPSLGFS